MGGDDRCPSGWSALLSTHQLEDLMQISTGNLYDSPQAARDAGVPDDDIVELLTSLDRAEQVSRRVKLGAAELAKRDARREMQKRSRKANRG